MRSFKFFQIKIDEGIAEVILNNSARGNCLNEELWYELPLLVKLLDENESVKVVLLKSHGKHFSTGIDIKFLHDIMAGIQSMEEFQRQVNLQRKILEMQNSLSAIENSRVPWMALIHGLCLGAGIDLISACDIRIGTFFSHYSILETKLGIVADMGTIQRLQRVIPEGKFKELLYTSKIFSGIKAYRYNLLNKVYPNYKLAHRGGWKLAREIARMPGFAIEGAKNSFNFSRENTVSNGLHHIAELNSHLLLSPDAQDYFKRILKWPREKK